MRWDFPLGQEFPPTSWSFDQQEKTNKETETDCKKCLYFLLKCLLQASVYPDSQGKRRWLRERNFNLVLRFMCLERSLPGEAPPQTNSCYGCLAHEPRGFSMLSSLLWQQRPEGSTGIVMQSEPQVLQPSWLLQSEIPRDRNPNI